MIYLNDKLVNFTIFPDGTSQCWKIPESDLKWDITKPVIIRWDFSSEREFLQLAQLKTLLDLWYKGKTILVISYLPYARQDKEVSNETTFALHTFANLLNSLNFSSLLIDDPHSSVSLDVIKNSIAVYPIEQVKSIYKETESDLVCYPDNGAYKKYFYLYHLPCIHGVKVRDPSNGKFLDYRLDGIKNQNLFLDKSYEVSIKDKRVLLVDDLADAGGTFILASKKLYEEGVKEVNLFVTHGLFTKGLAPLKEAGIKRIFDKIGERHDP